MPDDSDAALSLEDGQPIPPQDSPGTVLRALDTRIWFGSREEILAPRKALQIRTLVARRERYRRRRGRWESTNAGTPEV
jgi:hypothetical protein